MKCLLFEARAPRAGLALTGAIGLALSALFFAEVSAARDLAGCGSGAEMGLSVGAIFGLLSLLSLASAALTPTYRMWLEDARLHVVGWRAGAAPVNLALTEIDHIALHRRQTYDGDAYVALQIRATGGCTFALRDCTPMQATQIEQALRRHAPSLAVRVVPAA